MLRHGPIARTWNAVGDKEAHSGDSGISEGRIDGRTVVSGDILAVYSRNLPGESILLSGEQIERYLKRRQKKGEIDHLLSSGEFEILIQVLEIVTDSGRIKFGAIIIVGHGREGAQTFGDKIVNPQILRKADFKELARFLLEDGIFKCEGCKVAGVNKVMGLNGPVYLRVIAEESQRAISGHTTNLGKDYGIFHYGLFDKTVVITPSGESTVQE